VLRGGVASASGGCSRPAACGVRAGCFGRDARGLVVLARGLAAAFGFAAAPDLAVVRELVAGLDVDALAVAGDRRAAVLPDRAVREVPDEEERRALLLVPLADLEPEAVLRLVAVVRLAVLVRADDAVPDAAAAGLADDIVLAAAVRALAAVVMALVAVFIACMAVDIVLADVVALVAAAVILVAAEVTLVAADDTVRAADAVVAVLPDDVDRVVLRAADGRVLVVLRLREAVLAAGLTLGDFARVLLAVLRLAVLRVML
jgi:hypothetical protein